MSVFPVIVRELRSQARQPLTHWLRIAGAVSVAAAAAVAFVGMQTIRRQAFGPMVISNPIQAFGISLFGKMNLFMFATIWLFVPLTTADALSRERREGTLPLLYLTELRSVGIVVGKSFVHLLRSISLFLTMAPWLMLPVVFGGVGLSDVKMAVLLDLAAVLLAHSAGLIASTIPRDWLKSVILAEVFAFILLLTMLYGHRAVLSNAMRVGAPAGITPATPAFWTSGMGELWYFLQPNQAGMIARTVLSLEFTTNGSLGEPDYRFVGRGAGNLDSHWQRMWRNLTPAGHAAWFLGVGGMLVAAGFVLVLATLLGAWRVKRSWHDVPAPLLDSARRRKYFSPRFRVASLKRNLSRALTANPIGWLQNYSPSARLVKWAWCFSLIVVEIVLSANYDDLYRAQAGLGLILLLGLTFSATGSFREELETGAFELLLVTPLRERQIILGRVRGLWRQFLPAILVYGAGGIYLASGWSGEPFAREAWIHLARMMAAFCALPLIGLYFSVYRWNFFAAWLGACVVGLLPPALGRAFGASEQAMIALQLALAFAAGVLLERRLRSREFIRTRRQC
jgi:ABC-type transport system involved in cytochrome c biogenesis permease component